jgi:uncharacterized membrane protein YdjX (TVP38/TMEM64 family)
MLVIMTLQNLFTFIPLILVITANIALFGFWKGYLYGCLCSSIGSTLIFLSIRYLFQDAFTSPKIQKVQNKIEKNGFLFVLSGRILPFMPTNLINISSALSSIKTTRFVLATTLGNMIYAFLLSSVSFSLLSAANHNRLFILPAVLVILIFVVIYRVNKKRHKKTESEA